MARDVSRYLLAPLLALGLFGCRFVDYEERESWRAQAEEQCLAGRQVQPSAFLEPGSELNGNGVCGMTRPFKVAAMSQGFVAVEPQATLACPLIVNLDGWFAEAVQPAAAAWLGEPVVEIRQLSAYACRSMNGQRGAPISEHSFGNALDIAAFKLQSGREVTVKDGWRGRPEERGFLRQVQAAACERFSTVLGPGADVFHYDHFHVDLARRPSGRSVCKPEPQMISPPPMPQGVPVARAPSVSPWARGEASNAPQPASGPYVIERERDIRPAGPPLVLGGQAPSPHSFGRSLPLEDRVRQALGTPAVSTPPPFARPIAPPANRPVPPAPVPTARRGADALVTGSTGEPKRPGKSGNSMVSPQPIAEQVGVPAAPASVFDLLPKRQGND
jgi:hypothetical protein